MLAHTCNITHKYGITTKFFKRKANSIASGSKNTFIFIKKIHKNNMDTNYSIDIPLKHFVIAGNLDYPSSFCFVVLSAEAIEFFIICINLCRRHNSAFVQLTEQTIK